MHVSAEVKEGRKKRKEEKEGRKGRKKRKEEKEGRKGRKEGPAAPAGLEPGLHGRGPRAKPARRGSRWVPTGVRGHRQGQGGHLP